MTGFWFFAKIPSVTMADSEAEDDGSEQGSRHEEESEEGDDDVLEVQPSGSRASAKPILRLPGRLTCDTWYQGSRASLPGHFFILFFYFFGGSSFFLRKKVSRQNNFQGSQGLDEVDFFYESLSSLSRLG